MKDRLYLFQCYPQITTTLTFAEYTDDSRTATKEVTPGLSEVMMLAGAKTPTEYAIEEIDPYMLRELIQAIYVEAPDKSSGKRRQHPHQVRWNRLYPVGRTDETRIKQRKTA